MTMLENEGEARSMRALAELGMSGNKPSHHRSNLIEAIAMFAGLSRDDMLDQAANKELEAIREENRAARDATSTYRGGSGHQ